MKFNKLTILVFVAICFLSVGGLVAKDSPKWEFLESKDGVNVFKKLANDKSGIVTIKADGVVNASIESVSDVLYDIERTVNWMPRVKEKKNLKRFTELDQIDYTLVDLPWPLKDRYYITRSVFKVQEDGTTYAETESVDDYPDYNTNAVRGAINHSVLYLKKEGDNKTAASFELNVDPAGSIPLWMVNMVQKQWPHNFFKGMHKELKYKSGLQAH